MINFDDFLKVDIRVGKIVGIDDFPEARNPSYILTIDFGELGIKKSAAQLVKTYSKKELKGKLVMAVVNFSPKQIGPVMSEVLTLGVPNGNKGECILAVPDKNVPLGGRLY
ncbi:MAG: tRNA-binding protein [Nanoarchaeota archaeon]